MADLNLQFSIGGQWYYVNEVELVKYVSEYAKAYKNDLSLLPHSENDINRNKKRVSEHNRGVGTKK